MSSETGVAVRGVAEASRARQVRASVCGLLLVAALLALAPASAQAAAAIVPTVDCAVANPDGTYTAYFGYQNPTSVAENIEVGDLNLFFPGPTFQGQPTDFLPGDYSRVVSVTFDPVIVPTITWVLNGVAVSASASTPACYAAATGVASDVGETSATLNALIDPRGQTTTYHFDWGTTSAYGQSTPTQTISQSDPVNVAQALSGLAPGTTYHYRVVASNATVSTTGQDAIFTTAPAPTPPPPPGALAVTLPASSLTVSAATLNGVVNPQGQDTSYAFQWGTSTAYGHSTAPQSVAGNDPEAVDSTLSGLAPNTTYHYRLVASRSGLETTGDDLSFKTAGIPLPPAPASADVAVLAARYPGRATLGRAITYHLQVRNRGPATATAAVLRVLVPAGLRIQRAASGLGSCHNDSVITCRLGRLAPGARISVAITATALRARRLRTVAIVTAAPPDPHTANNFVTVSTRFVSGRPPRYTG